MNELADARHLGEPPVAERGQVLHRVEGDRRLVMPYRRQRAIFERPADDDGREAEADELVHARVVDTKVEHEDAVDAVLAPPAPVHRDLLLDVLDELDRERDRPRRELRLGAAR